MGTTRPGHGSRPGDDDELNWPAPTGTGDPVEPVEPSTPSEPAEPSGPQPSGPQPPTPHPPDRSLAQARESAGLFDRSGAALAALGFGLVAGFGLPPLVYWMGLSILLVLGAPDTVAAFAPLLPAFIVPIGVLAYVEGVLRRSAPRFDGARVTLAITGAVTLGLWLVVAIIGAFLLLVLSSIG